MRTPIAFLDTEMHRFTEVIEVQQDDAVLTQFPILVGSSQPLPLRLPCRYGFPRISFVLAVVILYLSLFIRSFFVS